VAHIDVQSATSLPVSPLDDRRKRMRKYAIAMSIRTVCLILLVIIPDWWRYIFGVGAIVLPYVAVVLANVGANGASSPISPGLPDQLALEQRKE
jgi:predicted tellurium resistance membrane protein TerC